MASNKTFVFKKIRWAYPVAGEHGAFERGVYDSNITPPADGVVVQSLYTSLDRRDARLNTRCQDQDVQFGFHCH